MAVWSVPLLARGLVAVLAVVSWSVHKLFLDENGLGTSVLVGCGVCLISHC